MLMFKRIILFVVTAQTITTTPATAQSLIFQPCTTTQYFDITSLQCYECVDSTVSESANKVPDLRNVGKYGNSAGGHGHFAPVVGQHLQPVTVVMLMLDAALYWGTRVIWSRPAAAG